jgi:nitronate monooxygenase
VPRPFPRLHHPIVQAPLSGGPSTPELTAAVSGAGGLGFLATGYVTADRVRADIARVRELSSAPFGLNLFCLAEVPVDLDGLSAYRQRLEPEARRQGVELGMPRFDDDAFAVKLELVLEQRLAITSFTFGCPSERDIQRLHEAGTSVWVTVTDVAEALLAARAGADALILQGVEAGGHRGSFRDTDGAGELGLLALIRLVARETELPIVAAGGIADGGAVAAVLAAGACAAQIGSAFMRSPEAATSRPHRDALAAPGPTALTRAFSGRRARGIVNRFQSEHSAAAPSAYPHVNQLTGPLRKAAREVGDADSINLWAGQAYSLALELPAAELVRRWSAEARAALDAASARLGEPEAAK